MAAEAVYSGLFDFQCHKARVSRTDRILRQLPR